MLGLYGYVELFRLGNDITTRNVNMSAMFQRRHAIWKLITINFFSVLSFISQKINVSLRKSGYQTIVILKIHWKKSACRQKVKIPELGINSDICLFCFLLSSF